MINQIINDIEEISTKPIEEFLKYFIDKLSGRIALASSLSYEDQVLTYMIMKINPGTRIFIIDTGRLHQETYDLISETRKKYGINYEFFAPDAGEIEMMQSSYGPNLFYDSIEKRKMCCDIRKVRPLNRALSTLDAWITGLRREQSLSRFSIKKIELDSKSGLIKLNPLADWPLNKIIDYVKEFKIPYNKLYDKGFTSIGCLPCTRALKEGEDIRAGRWWWEDKVNKECGMHK